MWDNRGDWGAFDLAGRGQASAQERVVAFLAQSAKAVADTVRFLNYRIDLYRTRRDLAELTDDQLRDVGLTRRQAEREAARPFFED